MKLRKSTGWLTLTLALFLAATRGYAPINVNVGRYDTVHVVPAPGKVTPDGDLSEWDKSGEFYSYRFETEKQTLYFKGYMMYDAENLYLAAHVGDRTPMMNLYNPESEANVAWRGDGLQVRLSTDPKLGWPLRWYTGTTDPVGTADTIAHLTMWYYTPKAQPCLQIAYGMNYHGLVINPAGFQGAYKKDADGKGYVLEYSIPWKLLGAAKNPPKGGDLLACVWQMLWSDPAGRNNFADASEIRNPNNAGMVYQESGSWGKAIYEPHGNLPAGTVVAHTDEKAPGPVGFFPIAYNVPGREPAKVSLHLSDAAGHTVRWLLGEAPRHAGKNTELWDGTDNDGQPVAPGTYTVHWAYQRNVKARLLATADNAGNPPWATSDNTGGWAGDYVSPVAVTSDGKFMFVAHRIGEASRIMVKATPAGQRVWGVDTTLDLDGGVIAMASDGQFLYVLQGFYRGAPPKSGFVKISCDTGFNSPIGNTGHSVVAIATTNRLTGIAVNADTVFVAAAEAGQIFCIDKNTGRQTRTIDGLDQPRGLAFGPEDRLYVVTQTAVLRLNVAGDNRQTVVTGLSDPQQLCVSKTGDIFVSVHGSQQQVLRFDAQGKPLNAIGRAGGLVTPGPWVNEAMRKPLGVCLSPDGTLWVSEGTSEPKRTSVWQVDGKFVREFLGPSSYAAGNTVDPQQPEYIYSSNTKFQIDYATKKSRPVAVIWKSQPSAQAYDTSFDGMNGHNLDRFIHKDGRTFVSENAYGCCGGLLYEVKNDRWVGIASTGNAPQGFVFALDRNQNGRIDTDEIQAWGLGRAGWGEWVDDQLNVYLNESARFWRLPFEGYDSNGVPRYDIKHMQLLLAKADGDLAKHPEASRLPFSGEIEGSMVDSDGNLYLLINNGVDRIKRDEGFLDKGHRIAKFSPDGKQLLWDYRNVVASHPASRNTVISKPGEVIGAIKFTGQFGRYITLSCYYGQYVVLDKETGLFITAFTPDSRADPTLDEYFIGTENFNGCAGYSPKLKKYLFSGGDAQARLWEIQGLDAVKFGSFTVNVTANDHARALAATGKSASAAATNKTYTARQGPLTDAQWLDFGVDAQRKARAAVTWDAQHLTIAFDVTDDSPMRNRGSNNNLLFKTGDCAEFCVSSAAADVARPDETPVVGDKRILIALVQDQPVAMVYEPRSARPDKTPGTFVSPTGHATYDNVGPLQKARVTIKRRAGGYTVEAQFEAAELGLTQLAAGQKLRADFGALFSDKGGTVVLTRAMWADNSDELGVNNDIPTEARLHPKRWGWIELR